MFLALIWDLGHWGSKHGGRPGDWSRLTLGLRVSSPWQAGVADGDSRGSSLIEGTGMAGAPVADSEAGMTPGAVDTLQVPPQAGLSWRALTQHLPCRTLYALHLEYL